MKQGSTDDPFADSSVEDSGEPEETSEGGDVDSSGESDPSGEVAPSTGGPDGRSTTAPAGGAEAREDGPQRRSLPYIHARDGVKDGRTQRPVFLRDHVEAGIDELVAEVEADLGEDVYKTDVTEAAMAVAQEHPELVLAKLEEWGYGWS
ncbi:MAG: hypothetical protein ABEJ26_12330 [Halosimplex sp.]